MTFNFSLIICTYMRPQRVLNLLQSVVKQTLYPNEILIIDGSTNLETETLLKKHTFKNLTYYKVGPENTGLTKQRNYGIARVATSSTIISFLDDDTELTETYFQELINTYKSNPEITGVGGLAINENRWELKQQDRDYAKLKYYEIDGYVVKEGQRNMVRNFFGLQSNKPPMVMPEFSNGTSYGYPFNTKIYEVDLLVGMSFSFHRKVFENINFSNYFKGYGLYEDADYSLRALHYGKNVINTKVQLYHYHESSGRPNQYKYGKMVIRNGWYVWRVKYPKPSFKAKFKWHGITCLLIAIRLTNVITSSKRKEALTESLGRVVGWVSLIFNTPK